VIIHIKFIIASRSDFLDVHQSLDTFNPLEKMGYYRKVQKVVRQIKLKVEID
jgi:hypothetical protein